MANIYGRQVVLPLTNKSGGQVVLGDVVAFDGTNSDAFTTTAVASTTAMLGVAQETIANNGTGRILFGGYTSLVNVAASVTNGHVGIASGVAKQAADNGTNRTAGTFLRFLTSGSTPDAHVWATDLLGTALSNPMTTTGDTIYSSDNAGTPTRLAIGSTGKWLGVATGLPSWTLPPGYEFDYAQITAGVTVNATTEGSANTVITGNAVSYDGATVVMIEFFAPQVYSTNTANIDLTAVLYDGASSIGQIGWLRSETTNRGMIAMHCMRRLTPSNAAHTYSIRAFIASGSGAVQAGIAGSGNLVPAFIRITKVA